MAPDREITLENCKEAFGLDTELTSERAAEITIVLGEVLKSDSDKMPLDILRGRDYSLAEFFINQPFDESALSGELRRYIREDPRVDALERAITNTAERNTARPTGRTKVPQPTRAVNTQALRQKRWLTEQLVIFELIRDCPQAQGAEAEDRDIEVSDDEAYEDAG